MKITRPIAVLCAIGIFCAWLVATAVEEAEPEHKKIQRKSTAILLATASVKEEDAKKPKSTSDNIIAIPEDSTPLTAPEARQEAVASLSLEPIKPPQETPKRKYTSRWAIVTAYCPCPRCCGRHSNGRTSTGTSAWRPGIAADPTAIKYGTIIEIPGYGIYKVDDTGGAMRQSWRRRGMVHLDIRMTYHWQARKWGRRTMKVKVYE